jgi:asparagine synthetase B (glutamine-hydrolysing)
MPHAHYFVLSAVFEQLDEDLFYTIQRPLTLSVYLVSLVHVQLISFECVHVVLLGSGFDI